MHLRRITINTRCPRSDYFQLTLSRAELFALRGLAAADGTLVERLMWWRTLERRAGLLVHTDGPDSKRPYLTLLADIWRATNAELRP